MEVWTRKKEEGRVSLLMPYIPGNSELKRPSSLHLSLFKLLPSVNQRSFRSSFNNMAFEDKYQQDLSAKYDCLLFDVDDTLYPLTSGLSSEVTNNIQEYMVQKLGIEEHKVFQMNKVLYRSYGTSMAGLKAIGYDFDNDDYHSFVHGSLPYDKLKPDHVLRNLLHSLPLRKVIFSNGDRAHVAKVLRKLGLEDCFEGIICFETLNPSSQSNPSDSENEIFPDIFDLQHQSTGRSPFPKTPVVCKPHEDAFEQAFKFANINPQTTVFFDDSVCNIQTGKRMGLRTVLVGTSNRTNGADYAVESIHNIKEALPKLWEANKSPETIKYTGKIAMETSVRA